MSEVMEQYIRKEHIEKIQNLLNKNCDKEFILSVGYTEAEYEEATKNLLIKKSAVKIKSFLFDVPHDADENQKMIIITQTAQAFADEMINAKKSIDGIDGNVEYVEGLIEFIDKVVFNTVCIVMRANDIMDKPTSITDILECISTFDENVKQYADTVEAFYENKGNPYYYQLSFIKKEMLGSHKQDTLVSTRGLRYLTNILLKL